MRVVIVGAGLSGLTLAAFLRRLNIDAVVLEQRARLTEVYVPPYVLYANALSCFKAYNLENCYGSDPVFDRKSYFGIMNHRRQWLLKIRNREVFIRSLSSRDALPMTTPPFANSNSVVSLRSSESVLAEMGRVPLRVCVSSSMLLEELRRHCMEIKFGCRVVDLVPYEGLKDGVQVCLQDGRREYADIVVGADGVGSVIRRILYPCEHVGITDAHLGIVRVDGVVNDADLPRGVFDSVEMWGRQRTLALSPLIGNSDSSVAFTATMYKPTTALVPSCDKDLLCTMRTTLSSEFSDYESDIAELLGKASFVALNGAVEVPIMPRWFNRRAVLIGDAAHAALPSFLQQDASLCVEDAAILATALLDIPFLRDSGVEYAFRQYESVRRGRVERYIRQARRAQRFAATSHVQVRNMLLRAVSPTLLNLPHKWLSSWTYSAQQTQVDPRIKAEMMFR